MNKSTQHPRINVPEAIADSLIATAMGSLTVYLKYGGKREDFIENLIDTFDWLIRQCEANLRGEENAEILPPPATAGIAHPLKMTLYGAINSVDPLGVIAVPALRYVRDEVRKQKWEDLVLLSGKEFAK